MQCVSCQFENMPGNDYCGRCGTSLKLAEATISVQPPRAGAVAKRLRRWLPFGRAYRLARSERSFPTFAQWAPRGWSMPLDEIIRLALPGWAHWYQGRSVRGWIYFSAFTALLLGGLALFGTATGSILLGLAVGVHSSYVIDATSMTMAYGGRWSRLFRGAFVALALGAAIYAPIGLALMQIAEPVGIMISAPPLQAGDVLLTHHFGTPEVGGIVVYEIPFQRLELSPKQYTYVGGRQVDRILAGPGTHVFVSQQQLYINGTPSRTLPLNPTLPEGLNILVPADSYLILPTTAPFIQRNTPITLWNDIAIVHKDQILSTVYFRNQPWSRFGRLP